jgi:hypothetical protein
MATWTLKTLYKKSAYERQHWYKDGKEVIREEGYRWGTFYCESDEQPEIDLENSDEYNLSETDYDWELESLDDGCWAEWEYPDDLSEEEREEIENAWEENYFEGMEELGWSNDETEYILQGPLELSDKDGNVVGSGTAQLGFQAATGTVRNPMLEMIYSSPGFRSFQFEFTFYPRDEREALEVQRIIERFRFHQAPELVKGAEGFLIPPSEFDIKFYYAGSMNPNIPAMATTVLTQIDVNYTPNGWTAYEVPGENKPALGRTGMPVAIQLALQFKETTFLTKDDFKNDTGVETLSKV